VAPGRFDFAVRPLPFACFFSPSSSNTTPLTNLGLTGGELITPAAEVPEGKSEDMWWMVLA
jgi:hypothetical protein